MSHQTFYRKYRSQTFADLVGQDHVIQTLKNAMNNDRLTHAHIFSGPRGTGKTSSARILAKSLNCREGESESPCLKCDLCEKIAKGNAVDVIEIDAASNTGVDNIRTLNDQVNFAPVECKYKIYIIDEAHMLSTGAFNALLKTLEEPPANTIFILATTEPHKLPITIHSRCQHLHFRLMSTQKTIKQLQKIADAESITIDEQSLATIARNAGGSMRDAVSLLDQIYAFKGNEIKLEDVLLSLGASNIDSLIELMTQFFKKDTKATLQQLNDLMDQGLNMTQLISDILDVLKQLLFVKMELSAQLDLDEGRIAKLKTLSDTIKVIEIKDALTAFAKAEADLKWFPNPSLLLQVTFLTQLHAEKPQASASQQIRTVPTQNAAPQSSGRQAPPQSYNAPPKRNQNYSPPSQSSPPPKNGSFSLPEIPAKRPNGQTSSPNTYQQSPPPPKSSPKPSPQAQKKGGAGSAWDSCQEQIRTEKHALYALVKGSTVTFESDTELTVTLSKNFKFFRDKLKETENKTYIESVIKQHYKKPLGFNLDEGGDAPTSKATSSPKVTVPQPSARQAPPQTAKKPFNNPFSQQTGDAETDKRINQIVQMFDGEVVS